MLGQRAMDITFSDIAVDGELLVDLSEELLAPWSWLPLPAGAVVVAASKVGDLFFEDGEGVVHRLDTHLGLIDRIADNEQAFFEGLEDNLVPWFRCVVVFQAREIGAQLEGMNVFALGKPVALGGEFDLENLVHTDLKTHVHFQAELLRKLAELPPGGKLEVEVVNGRSVAPTPQGAALAAAKQAVVDETKAAAK